MMKIYSSMLRCQLNERKFEEYAIRLNINKSEYLNSCRITYYNKFIHPGGIGLNEELLKVFHHINF